VALPFPFTITQTEEVVWCEATSSAVKMLTVIKMEKLFEFSE
jgi:hypothetical protein